MYLSKSCIYAIRSSLLLAAEKDRKYTAVKEISESLQIPFHYLTKILQILSHNNIIASIKGPHGGVRLKKAAREITLFDIIVAIDGDFVFSQCTLGLGECSDLTPCILHDLCYETKQTLLSNIKRKNLADISTHIRNSDFALQYCAT